MKRFLMFILMIFATTLSASASNSSELRNERNNAATDSISQHDIEYYNDVKQRIYATWQQPAGAPVGLITKAIICIKDDGAIASRTITHRSGNAKFDRSVQDALDAITSLPKPPADLPDLNITVEFVLSD